MKDTAPAPAYDIEALKAEHGDRLFANTVKLPDELDGDEITIVWKPPTHGIWALFTQTAEKHGGVKANRLLLLGVAVHPSKKELIDLCTVAPLAVRDFLDEAGVTRFFGMDAVVSETETL